MLYHITTQKTWDDQVSNPLFEAESLDTDGFLHLATASQVTGVLERYYRNVPDLLLLHIDPDNLPDPALVRYEPATDGDLFPHLYGPLPKEAILLVQVLEEQGRN